MRHLLLLTILFVSSFSAFSQSETEYFDQKFKNLPGKEGAAYYKTTRFEDKKENSKVETTFYLSGEKYAEAKFIKTGKESYMPEGVAQKWHQNGQLYYTVQYQQGQKEGEALGYYANGKLKRREKFAQGKLVEGECFKEDGSKAEFYPHEVTPEYPGGHDALQQFLKSNVKYPREALRNGIEGTVVVKFYIDETGKKINTEVVRKADSSLIKEALRVVAAMPDFKPALLEGQPIAFAYSMPIRFGLSGSRR